jgi:hypothetical protein
MMKSIASALTIATLAMFAFANDASAAGCPGPTRTSTGPGGKTLTICLDGRYSTCVRDSIRLGYGSARATAYCNGRRAAGAIR